MEFSASFINNLNQAPNAWLASFNSFSGIVAKLFLVSLAGILLGAIMLTIKTSRFHTLNRFKKFWFIIKMIIGVPPVLEFMTCMGVNAHQQAKVMQDSVAHMKGAN
ncbi:hypothetical protein [Fructobacillus fructosus]|uniref:Uncharacterized protein n=1 Tax=Fructobacillus fructosus TaxID=1631 RepID=A0ABN9YZ69_9LACO|nr:hypothetical protein [Fructobacillus fructosus]MBC9119280.1 hypothetical protein [Fructobacillus fructosus]MBD9366964.1 hypothetical protein [Leuconostoc mesenteroides]CAK1251321.1 unnamed protein product [Fructobacillus fructosus]